LIIIEVINAHADDNSPVESSYPNAIIMNAAVIYKLNSK